MKQVHNLNIKHKTVISFANNIFTYETTLNNADKDQSDLLIKLELEI